MSDTAEHRADWHARMQTEERVRTGNPDLELDTTEAAAVMARGLMRGDKATFKAGYTQENAVITVCEVFPDLAQEDVVALLDDGYGA